MAWADAFRRRMCWVRSAPGEPDPQEGKKWGSWRPPWPAGGRRASVMDDAEKERRVERFMHLSRQVLKERCEA